MKKKKLFIIAYALLALAILQFSCSSDDDQPTTPPKVTTQTPALITVNSASVSGEITDKGNSEVTETGIIYSSVVEEPTTADNKITATATDNKFTVALSGLTSGTTYYVRAYAINSAGTGYGDVLTFQTSNMAPVATNVQITGKVEVNKTVTVTYTYTDAESDAQGTTTYQWFAADDAAGTNEAAIEGATESTYHIEEAHDGKYLKVTVTPKAAAGTATGEPASSSYIGAVGEATTVTFSYMGEDVTYGIITSPETGRKWMDRNLGATQSPAAIDDFHAFGDLFQWGRAADGHQLITRTGKADGDAEVLAASTSAEAPYQTSDDDTPDTGDFILSGSFPADWRTTPNNSLWQGNPVLNNPCPSGWHVPTADEWIAENLTTSAGAFTDLKLTYTGKRNENNGTVEFSNYGMYWTTTSIIFGTDAYSSYVQLNSTAFEPPGNYTFQNRAAGLACRCIKD